MVERDVTIYSGFDSFIIDSIFKDNYPFYSLFYDGNIKWKLYEDKDVSIVATVTSRKEYLLSININAIIIPFFTCIPPLCFCYILTTGQTGLYPRFSSITEINNITRISIKN